MPANRNPKNARPDPRFRGATRSVLLLALLGGGLLRLWFYVQWLLDPLRRDLVADEQWYLEVADRIAGGQLFGDYAFYFGPLYSYALAPLRLLGLNHDLVVGLQHLLGLVTVYLVYRLGTRLFGGAAGAVAALLFAFSPPVLYYESFLLMESLLALLVTSATLLLVALTQDLEAAKAREVRDETAKSPASSRREERALLFAGLLLGLAATGRPSLLVLPLVAGIFLWRQRGWHAAGLLGLSAALVIALPILHNSIHEGRLTPVTTSGGYNLYLGNGPYATGASTDVPFVGKEYDDGGRLYAEGVVGHPLSPQASSEFWRQRALAFMRENPGRTLDLWLRKAHFLWANMELPQIEWLEGDQRRYGALGFAFTHFALLGPLALIGWIWGWRRPGAAIPASFALVLPLMYLPFFVTSRYRVAWIPILCVFAGYGLLHLVRTWRQGPHSLRIATAVIFVTALALSLYEPVSLDRTHLESVYRLRQAERALSIGETQAAIRDARAAIEIDGRTYQAHLLLGSIFRQSKRWTEAERAYRAGLVVEPESPEGLYGLAIALHRGRRSEEALVTIEHALELLPRDARFVEYSGMIHDALGNTAQAEAQLRRSTELRGDRASAQLNYGTFLARHGRPDQAVEPLRRALELDPDSILARRNLVLALLQTGHPEEAAEIARPLPADDSIHSYLR